MCFVWIWEQTAIISLYSINWLVFITETECVYCAVRTGSLYIQFYVLPTHCIYVFCVDLRTNSDYFPIQHWLVFITETECVYCAVRTGSLYRIHFHFFFERPVIQKVSMIWLYVTNVYEKHWRITEGAITTGNLRVKITFYRKRPSFRKSWLCQVGFGVEASHKHLNWSAYIHWLTSKPHTHTLI